MSIKNPTKAQADAIKALEDKFAGSSVVTPDNPYSQLLEAITTTSADNFLSAITHGRLLFPTQANSFEDLYPHLADNELDNIFAIPGQAYMVFYVLKEDILNHGVKVEKDGVLNMSVVKIPKFTTINVDGIIFTLLSDVTISIVSNNSFVEYDTKDNRTDLRYLGNVSSITIKDKNNVERIAFRVPVQQVTMTKYTQSLDKDIAFNKNIPTTDQFYRMDLDLTYDDNGMDKTMKIEKTLSDIIFKDNITAKLSVYDNYVNVDIPNLYSILKDKTGSVDIYTYTTKGSITLPINKYSSTSHLIDIGPSTDEFTAAMSNVGISAVADTILDGGSDKKTLQELMRDVINRANGIKNIPITEYDITEYMRGLGFTIKKELDILNSRIYSATRELDPNNYLSVDTIHHLLLNKVKIIPSNNNNIRIKVLKNTLLIPSDILFKTVDGMVPLSTAEEDAFKQMPILQAVEYLNNNGIVYNPFYYYVNSSEDTLSSRIYDLDSPKLDNLSIDSKNPYVSKSANIIDSRITKVSDGYKIEFKILENTNGVDEIICSMRLDNTNAWFKMNNDGNNVFSYILKTDLYITTDNKLNILNVNSVLADVLINLETSVDIYLYSNTLINNDNYIGTTELMTKFNILGSCLTMQTIDFKLGNKLDILWNNVISGYTDRKYKTYDVDIQMRYTEDILDHTTGCAFTKVDNDGDGIPETVVAKTLHKKGDLVYDADNNPIYLHRKGDIVYENNEAIIDYNGGIFRYLDILVLPYAYKMNSTPAYKMALDLTMDSIKKWLLYDLLEANRHLLDRTTILFKPLFDNEKVKTFINNKEVLYDPIIKPIVTLSIHTEDFYTRFKPEEVTKTIGMIIDRHLTKSILNKRDIVDDIIKSLDTNVVGVDIKGIGDDRLDVIYITSGRFILRKRLLPTLIYAYDIDIETNKVI